MITVEYQLENRAEKVQFAKELLSEELFQDLIQDYLNEAFQNWANTSELEATMREKIYQRTNGISQFVGYMQALIEETEQATRRSTRKESNDD